MIVWIVQGLSLNIYLLVRGRLEVEMNQWVDFYDDYFSDREEVEKFVSDLEEVVDSSHSRYRAKIIMHQAQRLISLSDDIINIREGRESLQLLFLLVCAENVAKIYHEFDHVGQSKNFVKKFFYDLLDKDDRSVIEFRYLGTIRQLSSVGVSPSSMADFQRISTPEKR